MSDLAALLGRLHPALVHLPIGGLAAAALLAFLSRRPRFAHVEPAVGPLLLLSTVAAWTAAATGLVLRQTAGYAGPTVDRHLWLGLALVGAVTAAAAAWSARNTSPSATRDRAAGGLLALSLALLVVTGHLGGTITRGEGYLTELLPAPLRGVAASLFGGARAAGGTIAPADVAVFDTVVHPIFQRRCVSCHGADDPGAGLRLDVADGLRKGGESGRTIVAGNAAASELMRRISLPSSSDKAMPPRGHRPVTAGEAALLRWWIDAGAPYDATLADVDLPADVRSVVEATIGPLGDEGPRVLALDVPPPDAAAVAKAEAVGFSVSPLAAGTALLQVHATNTADRIDDAALDALVPLAPQVVWLDLSGTRVGDAGLARVARLPHLARLRLDRTAVTDAGLAHLQGLEYLESVNLYGTGVTDAGLDALVGLPSLRTVYVWRTAVTAAGAERLAKAHPRVRVTLGAR